MTIRLINICLVCLALGLSLASIPARASAGRQQAAESFPWAPEVRCNLNPSRPRGLHSDALSALQGLSVAHRITQGINNSPERGNVHSADGTIDRQPYTGAVDISVRCLTDEQIKALLGRLADSGFAAWYRKPRQDGWSGAPHIHAVWAGCRLKPVLQKQIESWLGGRNGLASDRPYQFWQPSDEMKSTVQTLYRASN